ncbi:hypothetical protein AB0J38_14580 [Streptomyces sp. NPDC050095]|uniref:hypothetical protein n=1 Tax=unclassified Streptomyces TaxID=2593676 RepID=UPI00344070C0
MYERDTEQTVRPSGNIVLGQLDTGSAARYVGRHIQGSDLSTGGGIAGHLRAVENGRLVIVNGFGVNRVDPADYGWVLHPGRFTLRGKAVE